MPNLVGYSAAKGGVLSLVRELAVELAGEGIRFNAVCPGATDTPAFWGRTDVTADSGIAARVVDEFPLLRFHQRLIDPGEIADAIMFLLSDESRMITGVALPVDGGYVAR
jgi:NAD(P)-dependent dehydrogenase (short-subunit alcohol dehydrogenase family)